jgi:two-component system nitrate/nitrite response regulator NarL
VQLSPQEERILKNIADGDPNKVIARALGIADSTVKVHVKNILRKLGVGNRTQAATWATRHGLAHPTTPDNRRSGWQNGRNRHLVG